MSCHFLPYFYLSLFIAYQSIFFNLIPSVLSLPVLSCFSQSRFSLSCLFRSELPPPVLFFPALSRPDSPFSVPSFPALSRPASHCPVSTCPNMSLPVLSCPVSSQPPTLSLHTLPCFSLSCPFFNFPSVCSGRHQSRDGSESEAQWVPQELSEEEILQVRYTMSYHIISY
jgi:hypothetical protein